MNAVTKLKPAGPVPAGAPASPILEVDGVTLQYKTKDYLITATYRVSFDVYPSDRFVLLGPSGCGKSTLLKGVAGYPHPVEGEMRLKGREIKEPGPFCDAVLSGLFPCHGSHLLRISYK